MSRPLRIQWQNRAEASASPPTPRVFGSVHFKELSPAVRTRKLHARQAFAAERARERLRKGVLITISRYGGGGALWSGRGGGLHGCASPRRRFRSARSSSERHRRPLQNGQGGRSRTS